jgi:cytoskeleton protein RodZ
MSTESDGKPNGATTSVGERLRAAREARQVSLREIAATTKISVGALEALEQSDVSSLPGGIFTRAFVRSYATEVGLDPEETMRDFVLEIDEARVAESTTKDPPSSGHDLFQSQQRIAGTVLTLILIGVPVALLLGYLGTRDSVETEDPAEPASAVSADRSPAAARVDPAPRPAPPRPAAAAAPAAVAPLTLVLSPSDECWVSLTIDGDLVFSRVMRPGESATYEAESEIILNIGDAGAFAFALNDQDGRTLGGFGEVATATITPQNYRSFIAR